jgi:hypothetical protein
MAAGWMLWHGGASYSPGYVDDDTEAFPSLAAAKREVNSRASGDPFYPGVSGDSAWVWFYDPRGELDPYPDLILERGPRGVLRQSRA